MLCSTAKGKPFGQFEGQDFAHPQLPWHPVQLPAPRLSNRQNSLRNQRLQPLDEWTFLDKAGESMPFAPEENVVQLSLVRFPLLSQKGADFHV